MSSQKEAIIREKRTMQATQKNLMGPAGKFGTILQAFGAAVMKQGSGLVDANFLQDTYESEVYTEYSGMVSDQYGPVAYRDEMLDFADDNVYNEGLLFDGLSRGLHLEIVYWHVTNEIKVSYRGFVVYKEVAGELDGYAPFPEWEDMIERLYKTAKEKIKKLKHYQEIEIAEEVQRKKKNFWEQLRMKWGI